MQKGKDVFAAVLPGFSEPDKIQASVEPAEEANTIVGTYKYHADQGHTITIFSSGERTITPYGLPIETEVAALSDLIHEYAHAVFENEVNPEHHPEVLGEGMSAFAALSEGFAIIAQLATLNELRANPQKYGFYPEQVASIDAMKQKILKDLHSYKKNITKKVMHG